MAENRHKGVSLAKGPVALVGLALLAYGITAFIFGGHSFAAHPISGTVNGKTWLGLEVNAWSSLLFIGAGALLLFGAPLHRGAKSMSLIVGLALCAASLIALYDKHDVVGILRRQRLDQACVGRSCGRAADSRAAAARRRQEAGRRGGRGASPARADAGAATPARRRPRACAL
jgi:hypothetical protein